MRNSKGYRTWVRPGSHSPWVCSEREQSHHSQVTEPFGRDENIEPMQKEPNDMGMSPRELGLGRQEAARAVVRQVPNAGSPTFGIGGSQLFVRNFSIPPACRPAR